MEINLKESNLKITKKREIILNILKKVKSPITAEEIYEKVKKENDINLSTIYRTLAILERAKLIEKVLMSDKKANYSIKTKKHGHYLVCKKCKNTIPLDLCPINDMCSKISLDTGYEITGHVLEIEGLCPKCK